jgi:hypothetical protein
MPTWLKISAYVAPNLPIGEAIALAHLQGTDVESAGLALNPVPLLPTPFRSRASLDLSAIGSLSPSSPAISPPASGAPKN